MCRILPREYDAITILIITIMNKSIKILTIAALAALSVSCAGPKKMAEQAENVLVKCQPEVLEVVGGSIAATVTVSYPAD